MNLLKRKLKESGLYILRIVIKLAMAFAFIYAMVFLGWKGIIGLFTGVALTAYLFISKNVMLLSMVKMFENPSGYLLGDYISDIRGEQYGSEKSKNKSNKDKNK